jgi:serine/threonine-protein kinase RsbW
MNKLIYERDLPSTTGAVADALTGMLDFLTEQRWINGSNTFCIRLCLEEALVNAVVHGNANEPSRRVHVRIFDEGETCRVCVHDEGKGFDLDSVEMADCSQLGGRGVCLIKEFMEDVRFNPKTKCLEMVFNRQTFSQACA